MSTKVEYDARLGGPVQLPDAVQTYRYTADRVAEIKSLLGAIRHPNQTKLVFQSLPAHMRRRAMSHNPKRLPRKHRAAHTAQMRKSGIAAATKRPSRKYRRKAGQLQLEYVRRQRRHVWLETHLWHAKRFHMVERWGYRLAQRSCDKTYRSSYRASAEHCLLQDVSYVSAVELSGQLAVLRAGFARITSSECGLGVCARTYVSGGREGQVELFRSGEYPCGAVGKVSIVWHPAADGADVGDGVAAEKRSLWMFAHASFYAEVVQLLRDTFALDALDESPGEVRPQDPSAPTLKPANRSFRSEAGVSLTELKDTLNRFRLTGALSHAVLAKAFRPKDPALPEEPASWFAEQLLNDADRAAHLSQTAFWAAIRSVRSATELTPNMVLALNVEDPRLNRPAKRTKALPEPIALTQIAQPSNLAATTRPTLATRSALWSRALRERITAAKMSTGELCKQRNRHALVPGQRCAFEDRMQPMPVLLVQRPGCETGQTGRLGYGGGWDVIVPSGYGISTWMALIMWGARAGGLREVQTVLREAGRDEFMPDTVPAKVQAKEEEQRLREVFFRKPPNKRINYTKLSINSPFLCRWQQLVADWSGARATDGTAFEPFDDEQPFYVLRNREHLQHCQQIIAGRRPFDTLPIANADRCLIPVHVRMLTRGNPEGFALICAPKPSDLRRNQRHRATMDAAPVHTEPRRRDAGEAERKRLRGAHLKLLKRLRGRRVRCKRREQQTADGRVLIAPPRTAQLVRDQLQRMRELWLPAQVEQVRAQCSREVLGYVTQAAFSLAEATVAGCGYITVQALRCLVAAGEKVARGERSGRGGTAPPCRVLVRGTSSRQYRLANVKVCV